MEFQIVYFSLIVTLFVLLIGILEWLHHIKKVKAEKTRLFFHAFTCCLILFFPILPDVHTELFLVSIFISIIWFLLKINRKLPSLLNVGYETSGFSFYPISIFLVYCIWSYEGTSYLVMYLPVLILGTSDVLATIVGRTMPIGSYSILGGCKTLSGSFVFFVSACLVSYSSMCVTKSCDSGLVLTYAVVIAIVSTVAEAVSSRGFDNISVPLSTAIVVLVLESGQI